MTHESRYLSKNPITMLMTITPRKKATIHQNHLAGEKVFPLVACELAFFFFRLPFFLAMAAVYPLDRCQTRANDGGDPE
jgi:hypothetical protein